MRLTVNGVGHDVPSAPLTTLLQILREELGVTSPKAGCNQGGCGACTVLVDGEPRRSCLTPVAAVEALARRAGGEVERVEVIEALSGHVCRCTGYVKIVEAATAAVRGEVTT